MISSGSSGPDTAAIDSTSDSRKLACALQLVLRRLVPAALGDDQVDGEGARERGGQ